MKTIASLTGPDFLRAVNRTRHAVEKLMTVAEIPKIRKQMPEFSGKETEAEKKNLVRAQVKKNMNDMLDSLLEAHPEETCEFLRCMCILEAGEAEPDGIELLITAMSLISDKRVLDFFTQLVRSGLFSMDA